MALSIRLFRLSYRAMNAASVSAPPGAVSAATLPANNARKLGLDHADRQIRAMIVGSSAPGAKLG